MTHPHSTTLVLRVNEWNYLSCAFPTIKKLLTRSIPWLCRIWPIGTVHQGFEKEARDILDQAMHEKLPHKNVGQALADLVDAQEKEEKEWVAITGLAMKQQQFFWDYAEAFFEPSDSSAIFAGNWLNSDGQMIQVSCENDRLSGKWETEQDGEDIRGGISRRAAQIKYKRKSMGYGTYKYWSDAEDGFAYLSRDAATLHVQVAKMKDVRFFSLTKMTDSKSQAL